MGRGRVGAGVVEGRTVMVVWGFAVVGGGFAVVVVVVVAGFGGVVVGGRGVGVRVV